MPRPDEIPANENAPATAGPPDAGPPDVPVDVPVDAAGSPEPEPTFEEMDLAVAAAGLPAEAGTAGIPPEAGPPDEAAPAEASPPADAGAPAGKLQPKPPRVPRPDPPVVRPGRALRERNQRSLGVSDGSLAGATIRGTLRTGLRTLENLQWNSDRVGGKEILADGMEPDEAAELEQAYEAVRRLVAALNPEARTENLY